jgi:hypothetical protein
LTHHKIFIIWRLEMAEDKNNSGSKTNDTAVSINKEGFHDFVERHQGAAIYETADTLPPPPPLPPPNPDKK